MASVQGSVPALSAIRARRELSFSSPGTATPLVSFARSPDTHRQRSVLPGHGRRSVLRAMVQQAVQGAPAAYAKEMERLSAKESLLLARIDVNERITGLERLNPTPRPTTSPFLEGRWNFEWFGSGSPGFAAARFIFERFPSTLANLPKMDVVIKDGYAKITAKLKFLNSIESKFVLSTKLSVEGPLRMKEEYVEGTMESPTIIEETLPEQLKGALGQATNTMQQLPVPIRDAITSGLTIPLGGTFQRLYMISYLDDEILIIRDTAGVPEVLTRLVSSPSPMAEPTEYES
ncbi:hypothetical protein FH972_020166 [Carpinus fangiana]|uniref:Plastid lipid-associated protein/fibrillin conserved domain-containing protein n=1 Tax=Carpinus fangiana TaxID=176857 RepID=A0A5N6RTX6_9ROSI|nr:hypothetical protein FH972_020166 [Carpinus fangiana]